MNKLTCIGSAVGLAFAAAVVFRVNITEEISPAHAYCERLDQNNFRIIDPRLKGAALYETANARPDINLEFYGRAVVPASDVVQQSENARNSRIFFAFPYSTQPSCTVATGPFQRQRYQML